MFWLLAGWFAALGVFVSHARSDTSGAGVAIWTIVRPPVCHYVLLPKHLGCLTMGSTSCAACHFECTALRTFQCASHGWDALLVISARRPLDRTYLNSYRSNSGSTTVPQLVNIHVAIAESLTEMTA